MLFLSTFSKVQLHQRRFEVESMEMVGKITAFSRWFSQLSRPVAGVGGHAHIYP